MHICEECKQGRIQKTLVGGDDSKYRPGPAVEASDPEDGRSLEVMTLERLLVATGVVNS